MIEPRTMEALSKLEWLVLRCRQRHREQPNILPILNVSPSPQHWAGRDAKFPCGRSDDELPSVEQAQRYAEHAVLRMKEILPYLEIRVAEELGYPIQLENLVYQEMHPHFKREVDELDHLVSILPVPEGQQRKRERL